MEYEFVDYDLLNIEKPTSFSFNLKIYLHVVEKKNHELISNRDSCV